MVIDRGAFHAGRIPRVSDEIAAVKEVCGAVHLKVIFETGELGSYDEVRFCQRPRDARRRRFHQDQHRQSGARGHAPVSRW